MNALTHQAITALDAMRLPELQARYLEVLGTPTRCPNRGFLVRRISEALAANDADGDPVTLSTPDENAQPAVEPPLATAVHVAVSDEVAVLEAGEPPAASSRPRGRFRGMTIEELRAKYTEVVGRSTSSSHAGYLRWKIREAEKGHVPIGPVGGRRAAATPIDVKVLPLRIEAHELERIDSTWRIRGLRSRMEFFRLAVGHYLGVLDGQAATEQDA